MKAMILGKKLGTYLSVWIGALSAEMDLLSVMRIKHFAVVRVAIHQDGAISLV